MAHLKAVPKLIPIRTNEVIKEKLIKAVGKVVANVGFQQLSVNMVAREAGVDKKLIYRHFYGLQGLLRAYSQTSDFWPSAQELLDHDEEEFKKMPPAELLSQFFKRYVKALLCRPHTLDILAWETLERSDLAKVLEEVRIRTSLEFFELMDQDPPEDVDLSALVLIMYATANFLAVQSRVQGDLGGVDLHSDAGWKRIEDTMDVMLKRTLG